MHSVGDESMRRFYQGEVLVPDWIPPHLIRIPHVDAFSQPLRWRQERPPTEAKGVVPKAEHASFQPKSLEAERSAEFCARRSCSNLEMDEATPAELQNKLLRVK